MVEIGEIPQDKLTPHGHLPMSEWGKTWLRVYGDLPNDATYALYNDCMKHVGHRPVPTLAFFEKFPAKAFRIVKLEGEQVTAIYRHERDTFILITAELDRYKLWCEKHHLVWNNPLFEKESPDGPRNS